MRRLDHGAILRSGAAILVAIPAACSPGGATKPSRPPSTPIAVAPAAPAPAPASSAAAPPARNDNSKLMALLSVAKPVCATTERVETKPDGTNVHAYIAQAPSVSRAELEQRFREAARRLGYAVSREPSGDPHFKDEQKHVVGLLLHKQVMLLFSGVPDMPRAVGLRMATRTKLDAAVTLDRTLGQGTVWKSVTLQQLGNTLELSTVLELPPGKLPLFATWAKQQKLHKEWDHWQRDFDPARPERSAVFAVPSHGSVTINEALQGKTPGKACADSPDTPQNTRPADKKTDDDLLQQMMQ